ALLAYHLINDYPEALEISSIPERVFEEKTIRNYNWMLNHDASYLEPHYYEGADGLKTGNTDLAGYCFTGTAERDGKRVISVVMKTDSEAARFQETAKLFDYGFKNFESKELFKAGYQVEKESTIPVSKGKEKTVSIELDKGFTAPIFKGEEDLYKVVYQ